ncbi:MAG: DUF1565 domain-containing protein [Thermoanaerobaculales bacterium]|nr:DUF1565 domain-containing protein [Thermoanaerobaculales bacterium]
MVEPVGPRQYEASPSFGTCGLWRIYWYPVSLILRATGLLRRAIGFALVWSLASGTVFIPGVWAATYYVNDDTGDDSRTPAQAQSAATPWQTITRAITEVTLAAGDTIDVAGGTYNTALGESFPMTLVDGVAIAGADSNTTTIIGPMASVLFLNNDTPLAGGTTLGGFTLTHDAGDLANVAMSFTLASADMAPVISENHFQGVGGYGQGINSISDGIYLDEDGHAPNPDFGGGDLSSLGLNTLMGNGGFDFYNDDGDSVMAQFNWWGTTDDTTIDASISDNEEETGGAVDFSAFLSAVPTVSATASLVDALEVDLSPPGPSNGDTIRYTATLEGTGDCGCASALFTVEIPDNGIFIHDSLGTSRGILINDTLNDLHPELKVGLGALEVEETVIITWDVMVDGGKNMTSQGTLSCYQLGDLLTDDPSVGGDSDPTTTILSSLFSDDFESGNTDEWSNAVQ